MPAVPAETGRVRAGPEKLVYPLVPDALGLRRVPATGRRTSSTGRGAILVPVKVLEGLKAIEPGSSVPIGELGLPVTGVKGLLLVFWKST
jgi:hypothetical protein